MNVDIVTLPAVALVMIRHRGPYESLSPKFDQLWEWVEAQNVPVQRTIGIYYDNPEYVEANRLRSAACVEVPPGFTLTPYGALPLEKGEIAAGRYAKTTVTGPYEGLERSWEVLTAQVEGAMGLQILEEVPAFEVYVNDPSDTPPHALVTELYMPVR